MMRADVKRLSEAERIGPTDRQTAKLDAARALSRREQAMLAAAGMDVPERRWFVLCVSTGSEKAVDSRLELAGIERWLPLVSLAQKHRAGRKGDTPEAKMMVAWPGYIFVKVANLPLVWAGLATLDEVFDVLGTAERPVPVPEEKVNKYKYQLEHDQAARKALADELKVGEMVKAEVIRNAEVTARVHAIGVESVSVEMELFGSMRVVKVSLAQIIRVR